MSQDPVRSSSGFLFTSFINSLYSDPPVKKPMCDQFVCYRTEEELNQVKLNDKVCRWINRVWFRTLFNVLEYEKRGHFIEQCMNYIIHAYLNWIDYPKGHHILNQCGDAVWNAVISEDGLHLYTATNDPRITHWDLTRNEIIAELQDSQLWPNCLDLHQGMLVCGANDGSIHIWDAMKHTLIQQIFAYTDPTMVVKLSSDGDSLFSASDDESIDMWSVDSGLLIKCFSFPGHWTYVRRIMLVNDTIIGMSCDKTLSIWDQRYGKAIRQVHSTHNDNMQDMSMNCDFSLFVTGSSQEIIVWDQSLNTEIKKIKIGANQMMFHPNQPFLLAISLFRRSNAVRLLDVRYESREWICWFDYHLGCINQLCFTPDGQRLISASTDGTIRVWDISNILTKYEMS